MNIMKKASQNPRYKSLKKRIKALEMQKKKAYKQAIQKARSLARKKKK